MCWKTNGRKPTSRKVMRTPITVYKVVYSYTNGIFSSFRDFRYNCPEVYRLDGEMMPEKSKYTKCWEIDRGYHSYSLDCGYDGGVVRNSEHSMLMDYSMFHVTCGIPVILECRIPKLARYYKNQNGEIVSDAIETVAVHTEKQWKERLEEIKKERHL